MTVRSQVRGSRFRAKLFRSHRRSNRTDRCGSRETCGFRRQYEKRTRTLRWIALISRHTHLPASVFSRSAREGQKTVFTTDSMHVAELQRFRRRSALSVEVMCRSRGKYGAWSLRIPIDAKLQRRLHRQTLSLLKPASGSLFPRRRRNGRIRQPDRWQDRG